MHRRTWWATVQEVTKNLARLSNWVRTHQSSDNNHELDSLQSASICKLRICSIWRAQHEDLSLILPQLSFYYKQLQRAVWKHVNNINPFCCILHLILYSADYVANCEIDLQSWGHPTWHSWHSVDLYFLLCVCVCMLSCCSHVCLCDPLAWSPPGSSVHRILQAGIPEGLPNPSPGFGEGVEPASLPRGGTCFS